MASQYSLRGTSRRRLWILLLATVVCVSSPTTGTVAAFVSPPTTTTTLLPCKRTTRRPSPLLLQAARARVVGVSVSSTGFWVILQTPPPHYLPLRVSDDIQDCDTATSAEALTILQLLTHIDMAGVVFPPETLATIVVLHCEQQQQQQASDMNIDYCVVAKDITTSVQQSIVTLHSKLNVTDASASLSDQNPWIRSRVRLPRVTLDEVQWKGDDTVVLQCRVSNTTLAVSLTADILEDVCYRYRPSVAANFIGLALALRYKSPISVAASQSRKTITYDTIASLQQRFPNYKKLTDALQPADRSSVNIERGFEIHQLQAALSMARKRGDEMAATKIRAKLDALDGDSLSELPVQPDSDTSSME